MDIVKPPTSLRAPGKKLWMDVTGKYQLRSDELRVLEHACRESDLIDALDKELRRSPFTVKGSMGQLVAHPLVTEIRQHRAVLARLLAQLKLPDADSGAADSRSNQARAAANARWGARGHA